MVKAINATISEGSAEAKTIEGERRRDRTLRDSTGEEFYILSEVERTSHHWLQRRVVWHELLTTTATTLHDVHSLLEPSPRGCENRVRGTCFFARSATTEVEEDHSGICTIWRAMNWQCWCTCPREKRPGSSWMSPSESRRQSCLREWAGQRIPAASPIIR